MERNAVSYLQHLAGRTPDFRIELGKKIEVL